MSGRVLIVEDESIVRLDIKNRLQKAGYTVVGTTAYGEEAIAKAGELHPDVILMDIQLKGAMNGIQAADTIRSQYDIPVIFLTANTDRTTLLNTRSTGPYGHLFKPFDDQDFTATIAGAIRNHQQNCTMVAQDVQPVSDK